jgi:hypothetical protein
VLEILSKAKPVELLPGADAALEQAVNAACQWARTEHVAKPA